LIVPTICPAQEADRFQLSGFAGDTLPSLALPDATSQDALLAGAPFPVSAQQEETKKNAAARAWNRRRSLDGKTIKVHSRR
jgi:hypothetical protein